MYNLLDVLGIPKIIDAVRGPMHLEWKLLWFFWGDLSILTDGVTLVPCLDDQHLTWAWYSIRPTDHTFWSFLCVSQKLVGVLFLDSWWYVWPLWISPTLSRLVLVRPSPFCSSHPWQRSPSWATLGVRWWHTMANGTPNKKPEHHEQWSQEGSLY